MVKREKGKNTEEGTRSLTHHADTGADQLPALTPSISLPSRPAAQTFLVDVRRNDTSKVALNPDVHEHHCACLPFVTPCQEQAVRD